MFYNLCVPLEYGRDVVTCFQPRHLGTQLELANRDHSILTLLEDRTRGTSRSNRMTGGRIKDAVTRIPRIVDNQVRSQRRTLESLREDAIDQASQDGVILSDAQLRNEV